MGCEVIFQFLRAIMNKSRKECRLNQSLLFFLFDLRLRFCFFCVVISFFLPVRTFIHRTFLSHFVFFFRLSLCLFPFCFSFYLICFTLHLNLVYFSLIYFPYSRKKSDPLCLAMSKYLIFVYHHNIRIAVISDVNLEKIKMISNGLFS